MSRWHQAEEEDIMDKTNKKHKHDWVKMHIWGIRFIESDNKGIKETGQNIEGTDYVCAKCKKRKTIRHG